MAKGCLRRAEVLFGEGSGDKRFGGAGVLIEEATGDRLDTHDAAELRADVGHVEIEGLAIQLQAILPGAIVGGGFERANLTGDVDVVVASDAVDGAVLVEEARIDGVDAIGFVVAERLEQHAVDDGEDGRVEADADGQGEHYGHGE